MFCGLGYKPNTIANDDSRVVNKLETSLSDDARVIFYNRHVFIVQATDNLSRAALYKLIFVYHRDALFLLTEGNFAYLL
jgi:hypothetical protein